jgi:hypothetical protein
MRLFGMMLAGLTRVLWMHIYENVHLSENRHMLFTGVSTISEAHAGNPPANFIFIANIVDNTLTRDVCGYFLTLTFMQCERSCHFFDDDKRWLNQLFSFMTQSTLS